LTATPYRQTKLLATPYQSAKAALYTTFQRKNFGCWVSKPSEQEMFQ
jgi:hypothetical protein